MSLDLSQLADAGPELVETIGGMEFRFSELPMGALARLQSWIRANVPHPIEAIKPHLEGLAENERMALLEAARAEAMEWPPQVGTPKGAIALLDTEAGQVEVLWEGLKVHHPGATQDDAARIYRALKREVARQAWRSRLDGGAESDRVRRIYATLFGTGGITDDDSPKGPGPEAGTVALGGISSRAGANAN